MSADVHGKLARHAGLAQLAEHLSCKEDVVGSIPTPGSTNSLVSDVRPAVIGTGEETWRRAAADVLAWAVKTRSGFEVAADDGPLEVRDGANYWLTAHVWPLTIREPARIVRVVRSDVVHGFAYGTLDGHPVSGEEAFVVRR